MVREHFLPRGDFHPSYAFVICLEYCVFVLFLFVFVSLSEVVALSCRVRSCALCCGVCLIQPLLSVTSCGPSRDAVRPALYTHAGGGSYTLRVPR